MPVYITAFILSFICGYVCLKVLLRHNFLRNKDGVPSLGGIGVLLSFTPGFLYFMFFGNVYPGFELTHILFFSLAVFIASLFDDIREFSLSKKAFIQVLIIGLFLIRGKPIQIWFIPVWGNYLLSFLWIMGITNVFNLLDIGDGLCAGVSLIAGACFLTALILSGNPVTAGLFACLCGALLSFLTLNFPPAKIMLGNSGSHFLGFLFAALSMHGDYATLHNPFSLLIPLAILGFPLIDTLYLIVIRAKKGIVPLRKSSDHIFLRLLSSGKNIKSALFDIYFVTLLWGVSGILLIYGINVFFLSVFSLAVIFTVRLLFAVIRKGDASIFY